MAIVFSPSLLNLFGAIYLLLQALRLRQHQQQQQIILNCTEKNIMTTPKFDAVIIPGGGIEPETNLPNPWVRSRLDEAAKFANETRFFVVLSRGTTHRPPALDAAGFPVTEAASSAKYLLERYGDQIKADQILVENSSLDTIGNAFFARVCHCEPMQLTKLCVITSAFHMPRTHAIFEWVFKLDGWNTYISYIETPNNGMSTDQAQARTDRELNSLKKLMEFTIPTHNSMTKLSAFLFTNHAAYNAQGVTAYENPSVPESGINGEQKTNAKRGVEDAVKSTY